MPSNFEEVAESGPCHYLANRSTQSDSCRRLESAFRFGKLTEFERRFVVFSTAGLGGMMLINWLLVKALVERSQPMLTLRELTESGVKALRGSVWRPNTLAI
jgi:hypothetical protein